MKKENRIKKVTVGSICILLCGMIFLQGCTMKNSGLYQISMFEEKTTDTEVDTNKINQSESDEDTIDDIQTGSDDENLQEDSKEILYVHVCGAVINPGVYEMTLGEHIFNAIDAAGGFAEDAAQDYINLAEPICDGMKIDIPTKEEVQSLPIEVGVVSSSNATNDGRININTADKDELCSITGIGETKAKAIVEYRDNNGYFNATEEICNVNGIGEGTYAKIKDEITVGK